MLTLYLDCDGVILDTINKSYQMLKDNGITDPFQIQEFYRNLDWNKLIIEAGEIDNSIINIRKLIASGLFNIKILTHVNSNNEATAKITYFDKVLPGVEVITILKGIEKADFVNPKGAILVDDFLPNLDYWELQGGIAVKFSDSGKESQYITITNLLDLLNINFKYKKKVMQ